MSTWGLHPDFNLHLAFKKRAYQGCDPKKAKIIIIGKDANFPIKPTKNQKEKILRYLENPINFINTNHVFHPFLCSVGEKKLFPRNYNFYKKLDNFLSDKISTPAGDKNAYYKNISIIDLFPLPTYGSSSTEESTFLNYLKLKMENIVCIEDLINNRGDGRIFITNNAFYLLQKIIKITTPPSYKGYKEITTKKTL